MAKKIEHKKGEIVGDYGMIFIKEIDLRLEKDGRFRSIGLFMCTCGKEFSSVSQNVRNGKTKSCGCSVGKQYVAGDIVGKNDVVFLKELDRARNKSGTSIRMAVFECPICGAEFERNINLISSGDTKSCGCLKIESARKRLTTHGLSDHPLYSRWNRMIRRCYDKRVKDYPYYGGSGVTVCDEWLNDFMAYYNDVTALEGYDEDKLTADGITIDRKKGWLGYFKDNVKWSTKHEQSVNRKMSSLNTSGYTGVTLLEGLWAANITVNGNKIYIGRFPTPLAAAEARDWYIIKNGLWEYKLQVVRSG